MFETNCRGTEPALESGTFISDGRERVNSRTVYLPIIASQSDPNRNPDDSSSDDGSSDPNKRGRRGKQTGSDR